METIEFMFYESSIVMNQTDGYGYGDESAHGFGASVSNRSRLSGGT